MAGFRVVWANEFVPIAQESYKANATRDCILDQTECYGEGMRICSDTPSPSIAATGIGAKRISQHYVTIDQPSPAIVNQGRTSGELQIANNQKTERRKFTIAELKRICAFPDDFDLKGTYAQQWERLGNSVPPLMMKAVAETIRDRILVHCTEKQYGLTRASA